MCMKCMSCLDRAQSISAPQWAFDLASYVLAAEEVSTFPTIRWFRLPPDYTSRRAAGMTDVQNQTVNVFLPPRGCSVDDQEQALLHELAHWITQARTETERQKTITFFATNDIALFDRGHGEEFYAKAFQLYKQYLARRCWGSVEAAEHAYQPAARRFTLKEDA